MRGKIFVGIMSACMAALAVQASAQATAISQDGRAERMTAIRLHTGLNNEDARFLQNIYFGNALEIRASEIAEQRAKDSWSKEYAREMIEDHQMAQSELKEVAAKKGFTFSNELPGSMVAMIRKLERTGNFDRTYRQVALASHADASNLLKAEIERGHDVDVRDYAVKMLPSVTLHYKMAMTMQTKMGPNAAKHGM